VLESLERGRAKRRASLRRAQWAAAKKGDRTMLVWLRKQLLGQKAKTEHEVTGANASPVVPKIEVRFVKPDGAVADEEATLDAEDLRFEEIAAERGRVAA
jgi:hypothetical protein